MRDAAAEAGRDARDVTPGLYITVSVWPDAQGQLDDYCEAYYGGPSSLVGLVQGMVAGSMAEVAERVNEYVQAGARHVIIRHATLSADVVAAHAPELHAEIRGV